MTLRSHQLCNSLHYHQCYRETCVWEWYNVCKKSSRERAMYCKTTSIKEINSCKYPTKQKRSPVDNNTQLTMPILCCFQLASNQWIDLIRLNNFTLSTLISCVRSWCKWPQCQASQFRTWLNHCEINPSRCCIYRRDNSRLYLGNVEAGTVIIVSNTSLQSPNKTLSIRTPLI